MGVGLVTLKVLVGLLIASFRLSASVWRKNDLKTFEARITHFAKKARNLGNLTVVNS